MRAIRLCHIVIFFIQLYQKTISLLMPGCCRFYPSCSQYAIEALSEYGLLKGCLLMVCRVSRCQPLSSGGYDPIPSKPTFLSHHQEHSHYHGQ